VSTTNGMPGPEAIAVVGMAGSFPGAPDIERFWCNLRDGVESISFFRDEILKAAGVNPALLDDGSYVKARGVLEDADLFDAAFFDFTPREAELLDPQQRRFLQCAWHALEDAGYDPARYSGAIGVYAGLSSSSYLLNNLNSSLADDLSASTAILGNDRDFFATRVSYKLNLKGPSLTVQTACSTSLVAVHMACQALLTWQCDMALAGGVSIKLPQQLGYLHQEGGIYSSDGHCRAFDKDANGTVGGSGVGVVVLKRLEEAIEDGDRIDAIVLSSAINNDGASKVGYTAPSVEGQAEVIALVHALANVKAATITYVETHGTGTALGDPIEFAALTKAFRASSDGLGFCAIGSLKTNVGHLDAAAGIAGFIKTVLALRHRQIPPSLHFKQPNPQINLTSSPFYVNTALTEWESDTPRRAGVSSFGMGGTNAHLLLQEAPEVKHRSPSWPVHLLTLSARSASSLEASTHQLADYLNSHPDQDLADVEYTLQVGRRQFEHRRILVCGDVSTAATGLAGIGPESFITRRHEGGDSTVAFMFTGQGSQYPDMGLELYDNVPEFRREIDECSEILRPHLKCDLRDVMYSRGNNLEEGARRLRQTSITQPALFVLEYSLARLWMQWGVQPEAMIGHSIGEYVAACLAGVLSLEDALRLVAVRGRLMESQAPGAMVAVPLCREDLTKLLPAGISIAAINAPRQIVVSGPENLICSLESQLKHGGVETARLQTSHAFHSAMMDPVLDSFAKEAARVSLRPPRIPFISNVTGQWITPEQATSPEYWVRHLRQPVLFAEGIAELLREPSRVLLEVGPAASLASLARTQCGPHRNVLATLDRPKNDRSGSHRSALEQVLTTLGNLWLYGAPIDWMAFHAAQRRRRTALPLYPFERKRFWVEPREQATGSWRKPIDEWSYVPIWKQCPVLPPEPLASDAGACLVFVHSGPFASMLVERLRLSGQRVFSVTPGERMEVRAEGFIVNPQRAEDYDLLLAELVQRGETLAQIIHAWSIEPQAAGPLDEVLGLGFNSLLLLAQSMARSVNPAPVDLVVVSRENYEVTGNESIDPRNALLLGPCRVIPQELPHIVCRNIDISGPIAEVQTVENLATVISDQKQFRPVIALRGGFRWVPAFESVPTRSPSAPTRLRQKGVYLITGGLGGVGLEIATELARSFNARLVLVSRHGLPPEEEWDRLLETSSAPGADQIRKVRALQALGAEVVVLAADCSDREQMSDAFRRAQQSFGQIHGVVHAAGVGGEGLIELKSMAAAREVLRPKVDGTLVIDELLRGSNVDFLVLFSSLSALLGGVGQADYSSANAFLNAFAQSRRKSPPLTISIAWDAWREVGMAARASSGNLQQLRSAHLKERISPQEGVDAFRRALSLGVPQVVVSVSDLAREIEAPQLSVNDLNTSTDEICHARPESASEYAPPRNQTERALAGIWEELLGIAPVGIHDDFASLGGHSLLASQAVSRIRRAFGVELSLRSFFEGPTVEQLASAVLQGLQTTPDTRALEGALTEIENLSEEEVERHLNAQQARGARGASHE
jgi:acyl transferase domain-containing protein